MDKEEMAEIEEVTSLSSWCKANNLTLNVSKKMEMTTWLRRNEATASWPCSEAKTISEHTVDKGCLSAARRCAQSTERGARAVILRRERAFSGGALRVAQAECGAVVIKRLA
ncbi:unnamed protein product [Pleuronectes platessa]|uniref:Uncharacterized protein n=1 Tax=Pleuronectes platessa TaxID=8262 RepID=A0A9N7ZDL7_PLEPL|nr:unnamed protein product [Pleuronectes platessa]